GRPADYIPELARADRGRFAIAVETLDGESAAAGEADAPFSIQSISKVFTLTLAIERLGDALWSRVGVEPSGNAFNSIVQLEAEHGRPRNPFINAGAIVVADTLLAGRRPAEALAEILAFARAAAGDDGVGFDTAVAASETATGHRNRSLAHFMAAEGNLAGGIEEVLSVYFHQCSLAMSARQLARAGRYLAAGGGGLAGAACTRRVLGLMLTCGHYDGSGAFAFRVGLPGKSGVGGGILAIVPGIASVAAWCPGLGPGGNSVIASRALERLAAETGWSVFAGG
ncbi:MAG: glutaminase, partial [Pseudomonadota bacterium]